MTGPADAAVGAFAPAKVNLYLHVTGRRPDGYHLLDSLVAFADIGDRVEAAPADRLSLSIGGGEAAALAGLGEDNLVMRAARLLAETVGRAPTAALFLEKLLPAAAGIGGGSSDAAATLRILDRLWDTRLSEATLSDIAIKLGADVPACLAARPVWVGGIGELLEPVDGLPAAGIVLANPRRPSPTAAVFRARRGPFGERSRFGPMPRDVAGLAALLHERCNDLTEPALAVVPEIADVLGALSALPGVLLTRISGSGATCFALFGNRPAALAAHARLAQAEPEWWSAAGTLLTRAPPLDAGQPPSRPV